MIRYEVVPIPMMVEVMICDRCGRRQVPVVHEAKDCAPGDEMDGVSLLSVDDSYDEPDWTRVAGSDPARTSFVDYCPGCQPEMVRSDRGGTP